MLKRADNNLRKGVIEMVIQEIESIRLLLAEQLEKMSVAVTALPRETLADLYEHSMLYRAPLQLRFFDEGMYQDKKIKVVARLTVSQGVGLTIPTVTSPSNPVYMGLRAPITLRYAVQDVIGSTMHELGTVPDKYIVERVFARQAESMPSYMQVNEKVAKTEDLDKDVHVFISLMAWVEKEDKK